jgi:putative hydrolase of the HAD superfamily
MAVLSNMPWEIGLHIRRRWDWVKELFDVVTFSCEIGIIKPERGIYEHTIGRLGLRADQCLFVDDTEGNVAAAREVGMAGLHFSRAEDLSSALA